MTDDAHYLFESENLGFRNWTEADLDPMSEINADPEVMRYFPDIQDKSHTASFIKRMKTHYDLHGFTYFAVETKHDAEFIGFIGMAHQTYDSPFTPAVDIGWRLAGTAWGKGFATEGAKACLAFAKYECKLNRIIAVCPKVNLASERVMQKIGMHKAGGFLHPLLKDHKHLHECLCYHIELN